MVREKGWGEIGGGRGRGTAIRRANTLPPTPYLRDDGPSVFGERRHGLS